MVPIATWEITSNDDPFQSISLSIYCAGCNKSCPSCHSPALQDASNGKPLTNTVILKAIRKRTHLIESVVFLGGEWTLYMEDLEFIAYECGILGKKTILYTGRSIFDLPQSLFEYIDIIIDGEYKEELKTNYKVPASSNQNIYVKQYQETLYSGYSEEQIEKYNLLDVVENIVGYHMLVHPSTLPINREN